MLDATHTGCRLVHGESDGLPGVVADRYGDVVVLQLPVRRRGSVARGDRDALAACTGARCIVERSDAEVRALEGLDVAPGSAARRACRAGQMVEGGDRLRRRCGARPEDRVLPRPARQPRHRRPQAHDAAVLNAFCYTGGFTLAALAGGAASVLSIDSSADALLRARANLACNPGLHGHADWLEGDVFAELRRLRESGRTFDVIVLDPAEVRADGEARPEGCARVQGHQPVGAQAAAPGRAARNLQLLGGVTPDLFQKIVAGAALDAKADAAIVGRLCASEDHPVALTFPEGDSVRACN